MFNYTQINYRFILLHVLYLRIFEMARLVAVCRTDDYQFDRRQLPLAVDDNLKVCIECFLLIMFPLISERWSHLVLNIVQRPYWCFNLHSLLYAKSVLSFLENPSIQIHVLQIVKNHMLMYFNTRMQTFFLPTSDSLDGHLTFFVIVL